jgi:DNA-binding transcriptional regulator YbjK
MVKIQDQIAALREKEAQLKARRQLLEAKEQTKARKDRERKIFLLGMALEAAKGRGEITEELITNWLDKGVSRACDREFLGLVSSGPEHTQHTLR